MTEPEPDNIILTYLRKMDSKLGLISDRLRSLEVRFGALESRFSAVEERMAGVEFHLEHRRISARPCWKPRSGPWPAAYPDYLHLNVDRAEQVKAAS